jgi:CRISPR-associated protein Cas5h
MKVLVFDIWGDFAHFKKIYATTTAVTYLVPTKPAVYGYIGAIIGLEKFGNEYLKHFANKACLVGISLRGSVAIQEHFDEVRGDGEQVLMRRMGINLRAELGSRKEGSPPKPTLTEYVYRPKYRLYIHLQDNELHSLLLNKLQTHHTVYTPTLGLAGLISNFKFIGEFETQPESLDKALPIHSIIPKKQFLAFENSMFDDGKEFYIVEQSMYAVEMDEERNVTERDDILLERTGKPVLAKVKQYYPINGSNIVLF